MHAKVIQLRKPGPALGLQPASVMLAPPAPHAMTVRHTAVGVNFVDVYHRTGLYPVPAFPAVLGVEGVGVVEALGSDVRGFVVGQRVAWAGLIDGAPGGYASHRNIPAERAIALPDALDDDTVAATLVRGITAHMLLTRVRQVQPGDTVLVHAAAGGLGALLVQWAKRLGTRVIGAVGNEAKAAVALAHGADHVVLYRQRDMREAVLQLTGGEGVDYVIDGVGGPMLHTAMAVTRPFGMVASIGQAGDVENAQTQTVELAALGPSRSIALARPGVFRYMADLSRYRDGAQAALQRMLEGLRVPLGGTYPLEDAAAAHAALEAGHTTGALLLRP
ncbi:zinc-binding dehydrogenase [Ralstonia mannitolilytica]|uniref:2-haloacrylate reductase n=1 Tax=Ralstonia mannitolilytica TaxID=105219 RepID=A0AAD2EI28_9RALS|nr:zinc-binding dehydrogenase [Ralstonia mannitolilytica]MBY4716959.1 zinc-binding dehydrogenase [Ralstonia mannitolilytica]CAJ0680608.1 2-haloacrylate reductase [Ralstonia mannitolilytica]CAJ0685653.1 2-haloacrylate reductase [Ralstonia mannitolilytica]CAJ0716528.1 2-haloacrylate reductase [Ralstonia mannitolilytica]CAJ0863148.1 2-haloacrylate reductase [Ralstonia mannitolilytica]